MIWEVDDPTPTLCLHPHTPRYEQAVMASYMEDNGSVRLCPSAPWCGRAIQVCGEGGGPSATDSACNNL